MKNVSPPLPVARRPAHAISPRREEVTALEFQRLMISNRQLLRDDDMERNERGLLDPAEQVRYVIDEQHLFAVGKG